MPFRKFTPILIISPLPCKCMFYLVLNTVHPWHIHRLRMYTCSHLVPQTYCPRSIVFGGEGVVETHWEIRKQLEWEFRNWKHSGPSSFPMWKFIDFSLIEQFILQTLGKWWHLHSITDQAICPFVSVGFSLNQGLFMSFYEPIFEGVRDKTTGQYVSETLD